LQRGVARGDEGIALVALLAPGLPEGEGRFLLGVLEIAVHLPLQAAIGAIRSKARLLVQKAGFEVLRWVGVHAVTSWGWLTMQRGGWL
jgi:hypothetical protein